MKKINLLLVAIALCSSNLNAQPFYGETLNYQAETTDLSTAIKVTFSPGFLIGGAASTGTLGTPTFILNKLSPDGTVSGTGSFARYYYVYANAGCPGSANYISQCAGITVAEYVSTTSSMRYAVAGAADDGCFFVGVDGSGAIVNKGFYTFPSGATQATKPIIVVSNGLICIIGSFYATGLGVRQLYALKVSQTGAILQNKTYNLGTGCGSPGWCPCGPYGYDMTPNDAIISPYTSLYPNVSNEIIVVGEAKKYGNWGGSCSPLFETSGFVLRLALNNLLALSTDLYDHGAGSNGFLSVAEAQTAPGTEGFIIGGYSDYNPSFGAALMLKLDQSGTPLWSNLVSSTYGNPSSLTGDAGFRNSTSYGETYYGVLNKGNGAVVVKLDAFGNPFTCIPSLDNKNEFNYLINGAATISSNLLTIEPTASAANEGIHVFGRGNLDQYFVSRATFNGVSDFNSCSSSSTNNGAGISAAPLNKVFRAVNPVVPSLVSNCIHITVIGHAFAPILTAACQVSGLPANGTNNRPSPTGLTDDKNISENGVTFLPNPNNGKFFVNLKKTTSSVQITLFDEIGRTVKEIYSNDKPVNEATNIEVDLSTLSPGIYFARVRTGDNISCHKIVYTKN